MATHCKKTRDDMIKIAPTVEINQWFKNTLYKGEKMPVKSVKMKISRKEMFVLFSCPKDHSLQKLGF